MSTTIKIKCIDQTLTYEGTPTVASGGVNEDYVEFEFNTLWDGFSKVAVFYQNKGEIYYSLVSTDNTAVIPKEVIAKKGIMYLGVLGVKGNVTMTSQVLQYHIESGALDGFTPEEPTQEIYQQILAELQSIRDLSAETLSNEEAFEKAITEQQNSYESDLNNQWSTYKTDLTKQQDNYETNLNGQMTTFRKEVDTEITEKLSKVYRPCGSVATYDDLPTDAEVGDVYNLLDTGVNYAWTGTEWDSLAGIIDVSNYYNRTEVDTKLGAKINVADIVDNLTSSDTNKPLSAKQGKALNEDLKVVNDTKLSKVGDTMTGYLYTNHNGIVPCSKSLQGTMDYILSNLRWTNGVMGSFNLEESFSNMVTGWYNFIYIPHGTGYNGSDGDYQNYGTIIASPMVSTTKKLHVIQYYNGNTIENMYQAINMSFDGTTLDITI